MMLLLAFLAILSNHSVLGHEHSRRRNVWNDCYLPLVGDTNTDFYFYVNTASPTSGPMWSLNISGVTTDIVSQALSSLISSPGDPTCVTVQPYWYRFGPVRLNVGVNFYTFMNINGWDGFLETGPNVTQGVVNQCIPDPCDKRSWCESLPPKNGWLCHCNAGYSGSTLLNGTDCTPTPWAHYKNANVTFYAGTWHDSSTNGHHASSLIGSAPVLQNRTLVFSPSSGLQFPSGSIPVSFSIVVVARLLNTSMTSSIFTSLENTDWFLGWKDGSDNFVEFSIAKTLPISGQSDFLFYKIAATNNPSEIAVYSNTDAIGTAAGGTGGQTLVINKPGVSSDCEVQEVIIYDGWIYKEDLLGVSDAIDIDYCALIPCNDRADCLDTTGSAPGYTCICKEYIGWTGNGGLNGSTCYDRNDCKPTYCGAIASCIDLAPPNYGHICTCNTGYEGISSQDGGNCTDINECITATCQNNSYCVDLRAPSLSYSCICDAGYIQDMLGNCIDEPGCSADYCNNAWNQCIDAAPPQLGHTCNCSAQNGFVVATDLSTCLDADYCIITPCDPNAFCVDNPAPSLTRSCTCRSGYSMNILTSACDIMIPEPVQQYGVCQAQGDGTLMASCGRIGDAICASGLQCVPELLQCRSIGAGNIGDICGAQPNIACVSPLVCGQVASIDFFNVLRYYSVCRAKGAGILGSPCAAEDDYCLAHKECALDASQNLVCLQDSGGIVGDSCYSRPCLTGLICDRQPIQFGLLACRAAGNGTTGAFCNRPQDTACSANLICAPIGGQSFACRPPGNGALNANCDASGDGFCHAGLICDQYSSMCRPVGSGALGSRCGQSGDAYCGMHLLCAYDHTLVPFCRMSGTGLLASACGSSNDQACTTSLACSLRVTCSFTIPTANSISSCINTDFGSSCSASCMPGFIGTGSASFFCDASGQWSGTLSCTAPVTNPATGFWQASTIGGIAGGGAAAALFLLLLILLIVHRAKTNKRNEQMKFASSTTQRPIVPKEEPTQPSNESAKEVPSAAVAPPITRPNITATTHIPAGMDASYPGLVLSSDRKASTASELDVDINNSAPTAELAFKAAIDFDRSIDVDTFAPSVNLHRESMASKTSTSDFDILAEIDANPELRQHLENMSSDVAETDDFNAYAASKTRQLNRRASVRSSTGSVENDV